MIQKAVRDKLPLLRFGADAPADQPEPARMSVAIVIDKEDLARSNLRWPLRITKSVDADISLLVCVPKTIVSHARDVDLSTSAEQPAYDSSIAEPVLAALDEYLGCGQWTPERSEPGGEDEDTGAVLSDGPALVRLRLVAPHAVVQEVEQLTPRTQLDGVMFVVSADPERREESISMLTEVLRSTACSVAVVVPGSRQADGELLVAADRGTHGRNAINLAAVLAAETDRKLTSLYVEPDIGADAEDVGHRILDRLLKDTLEESLPPDATRRRVVVYNDPVKGIVETCHDDTYELLVLGAARMEALGELRSGSVPRRVVEARPDVTVVALRDALPLGSRLSQWMLLTLQEHIPQLMRAERIELVERIQSNAHWNFDFMLLIILSTLIAALGLLDNSAAVIIGAMLVAPLMTPLLGLGLAIAQGNARLAQITLKAASLGFLTAFILAYLIGLLSGDFIVSTAEMDSRDWPQLLDLIVAFVSGIAAAYASGRPGLLAALPGVAIAAALLPPVATAGLAMSIGNYDLSLGALLLFGVNVVAIVLAAAISLRAVGIRGVKKAKQVIPLLGRALVIVSLVMTLMLSFAPPLLQAPAELVQAVESTLDDQLRLRRIRLQKAHGALEVQVDLGGSRLPDAQLQGRLAELARRHIGEETAVRLTFRYETLLK